MMQSRDTTLKQTTLYAHSFIPVNCIWCRFYIVTEPKRLTVYHTENILGPICGTGGKGNEQL
jgi:hypothetical protein